MRGSSTETKYAGLLEWLQFAQEDPHEIEIKASGHGI
jgi:hypothetical protein